MAERRNIRRSSPDFFPASRHAASNLAVSKSRQTSGFHAYPPERVNNKSSCSGNMAFNKFRTSNNMRRNAPPGLLLRSGQNSSINSSEETLRLWYTTRYCKKDKVFLPARASPCPQKKMNLTVQKLSFFSHSLPVTPVIFSLVNRRLQADAVLLAIRDYISFMI